MSLPNRVFPVRLPDPRVVFILWICAASGGCATMPGADRPDTLAPEESAATSVRTVAERASGNPDVEAILDGVTVSVRMAGPAEVPNRDYGINLYMTGIGAGSLALGAAAPPLYASGLVVGGALIIPLSTYLYAHEKGVWTSVDQALRSVDMTTRIRDTLQARLALSTPPNPLAQASRIELVVYLFGMSTDPEPLHPCIVIASDLVFWRGEEELRRDHLNITEKERSADAPPPQCASMERFAEKDGRLVTDTLLEYADVVAVMAAERIGGGGAP